MLLFYDSQLKNTIPRMENIPGMLGDFQICIGLIYYPNGPFKTYPELKAHPYG